MLSGEGDPQAQRREAVPQSQGQTELGYGVRVNFNIMGREAWSGLTGSSPKDMSMS